MKIRTIFFSSFILILFLSVTSFAQDKDMMKNDKMSHNDKMMRNDKTMHSSTMISTDKMGVAINGYDPVSYFTDGKAEMGNKMYSYKWMDAKWYFNNQDNMKMFKDNPEKYAPAFGGYCAYAVSKGKLVSCDPDAWTIHDGKLYLNHNKDVKKLFKNDLESDIKAANMKWSKMNMKEGKMQDKMMDKKSDKN